jgi:hypothetical protein
MHTTSLPGNLKNSVFCPRGIVYKVWMTLVLTWVFGNWAPKLHLCVMVIGIWVIWQGLEWTPKRHVLQWDWTIWSIYRHCCRSNSKHNWEGPMRERERERSSISILILKLEMIVLAYLQVLTRWHNLDGTFDLIQWSEMHVELVVPTMGPCILPWGTWSYWGHFRLCTHLWLLDWIKSCLTQVGKYESHILSFQNSYSKVRCKSY